jgi:hypothetical protein
MRNRLFAAGAVLAGTAVLAAATSPVAAGLDIDAGPPPARLIAAPQGSEFLDAAYWGRVGRYVEAVQLNQFFEELARQAAAAHRSRGGGGGCSEGQIIARESGGNPQAVNSSSGAGGLYQILPSTWAGRGGYENAADAPVEMQQEAYQEIRASNPRAWGSAGC